MEEIQPTLAGCNGRDLTSYQGVTEGADLPWQNVFFTVFIRSFICHEMFDPRSFHLKNRKIIVNAKCLNYLRYMYRNDVITLVTCPRIGMTSLSLASLLAPIPVQLTTMSYFCSSWKVGKD